MASTCPHCGASFRSPLRPIVGDREVPTCPKCKRPLVKDAAEPIEGPIAATWAEPQPEEDEVVREPEPDPGQTDEPSRPLPLRQRARVAMALIGAVLIASLASLWADAIQLDLLNRVVGGERIALQDALASDDRVGATAIIHTVLYILSGITFLLWLSRAYRNMIALGVRNPRYRPRWAIAYWFIPILNLFRPKQVMNDVWRGSDPALPNPATGWRNRGVHPLLHWWWAAWLIASFAGTVVTRLTLRPDMATPSELRDQATGYVVADFLEIPAAVLAILVVHLVTKRAEERREAVADAEPESPSERAQISVIQT